MLPHPESVFKLPMGSQLPTPMTPRVSVIIPTYNNAHFIALAFCTCWQVCIFSRNNDPRLFWNMFIPTVIIGMGPGLLYDITGAWWTHLLAIFIPLPIAYFSKLCHA